MNTSNRIATVRAIALKTAVGGPMRQVSSARAFTGGGLEGSADVALDRGVTLISEPQWGEAMRELNADAPWHTRRANVLLDAAALGGLIGKRIRIGAIELLVTEETKPCGQMEAALAGLRGALKPDCRGGVCCRVVQGGEFRIGDVVEMLPDVPG